MLVEYQSAVLDSLGRDAERLAKGDLTVTFDLPDPRRTRTL
ncbi:hypothetical protein [Halogeometricum sp. CBA1124]|nr:hypothetical protein [Halogeometricum sp. CBA1124]